jgi:hypothetical protein
MEVLTELSLRSHSHARSKTVKVLVGKERQPYHFHKTLLASRCPYFAKCLNPSFPEGLSDEVVLEDETCEAFDHFFHWIYLRKLATETKIPFGAVYILADKFCMEALQNAIVNAAIEYCEKNSVPLKELDLLVRNDLVDSALVSVFLGLITSDIADRCGSWYRSDEESLICFGYALSNPKVMLQFLSNLDEAFTYTGAGDFATASERGCSFFRQNIVTAHHRSEELPKASNNEAKS